MKPNKLQIFLICIAMLLILMLCSSKKYYADFKRTKKQIDTLVLITPYVSVEYWKNKEFSKDNELEDRLGALISSRSYTLLKEKYKLVDLMLHSDFVIQEELKSLFASLEFSDKKSELQIPLFIQNIIKDNPDRYFLMVCFKGYYNAHFEPYHHLKQGVVVVNNTLYSSDMRILIFDNQKNIVVFYDKKYSKTTDPRIIDFIEQMTLDMLRPIYYK